jgi:peptidoglycan/LPS O-acetylase OafA/YrhL
MRLLVLLLLLAGVTVAANASAPDHWIRDTSRLAVPLLIGATARAVLLQSVRANSLGPVLTASVTMAALGIAAIAIYAVRVRQSPPEGTADWVAFVFVMSLAIAMTLLAARMARDALHSRRQQADR